MTSKRYARNPGADQIAAWKAAIAAAHRQQRLRRGKRKPSDSDGLREVGPGMVRRPPPQPKEQP
jgi:hypothetical protein